MGVESLILVLSTIAGPCSAANRLDSFAFQEIARIPYTPIARVTCGDGDHDGNQELYALGWDSTRQLYCLEFDHDMEYTATGLGVIYGQAWFLSDFDRDGKADLGSCDPNGGPLYVFESDDSASLPVRSSWQIPIGHLAPFATVTDIDTDSAREITLRDYSRGGIRIFECTGNNRCSLRVVLTGAGQHSGDDGFGVVPDLDRDGWPELFWVDADAFVAVYEAVSNDSMARVATCSIPAPGTMTWWGSVCGAPDIDRNGRTEAIVFAMGPEFGGILAIYESPSNDSFEVVWSTLFPAGDVEADRVSVGDVDADGVPEILATTGAYVRMYRCTGVHQYELFWECWTGSGYAGLYDINADGKDEVICCTNTYSSVIYEYLPVGVEERTAEALRRMEVQPSVARSNGFVRVIGLPPASEVEVVDASGRVVVSGSSGTSSFVLGTLDLKAGAYFVRIRAGSASVVRKILVVE